MSQVALVVKKKKKKYIYIYISTNAGDLKDSLGWKDSLEEEMAIHSSILALENPMDRESWKIPWG